MRFESRASSIIKILTLRHVIFDESLVYNYNFHKFGQLITQNLICSGMLISIVKHRWNCSFGTPTQHKTHVTSGCACIIYHRKIRCEVQNHIIFNVSNHKTRNLIYTRKTQLKHHVLSSETSYKLQEITTIIRYFLRVLRCKLTNTGSPTIF